TTEAQRKHREEGTLVSHFPLCYLCVSVPLWFVFLLALETMPNSPPDWQLPPGVSRSLWDYIHDPRIARGYDDSLADASLFSADLNFARQFFTTPGRLIDLGCGTGRLLLGFAARGFSVLGVDLSEEMLRVTREKAARAGISTSLLKANLVELEA